MRAYGAGWGGHMHKGSATSGGAQRPGSRGGDLGAAADSAWAWHRPIGQQGSPRHAAPVPLDRWAALHPGTCIEPAAASMARALCPAQHPTPTHRPDTKALAHQPVRLCTLHAVLRFPCGTRCTAFVPPRSPHPRPRPRPPCTCRSFCALAGSLPACCSLSILLRPPIWDFI